MPLLETTDLSRKNRRRENPPVSPTLKVLAYTDYVKTNHRWVALCVVTDGSKSSIRFYKWRWDKSQAKWKVDLARFSVSDVDLVRVAADAIRYSNAFKIRLDWKPST